MKICKIGIFMCIMVYKYGYPSNIVAMMISNIYVINILNDVK